MFRFLRRPKIVLYNPSVIDLYQVERLERAGYTPIAVCGNPHSALRFPSEPLPAQAVPCKACDGTGKRPAVPGGQGSAEIVAMLAQGICVACRGRGFHVVEKE